MLYVEIFKKKNNKISLDFFFNIFAHHIDCGYTLGPPRRGGSNGYPQCFGLDDKNEKNRCVHAYPGYFYINVGSKGVYFTWKCFIKFNAQMYSCHSYKHVFRVAAQLN